MISLLPFMSKKFKSQNYPISSFDLLAKKCAAKMNQYTDQDVKDGKLTKLNQVKNLFGMNLMDQTTLSYFPADSVASLFEAIAGKMNVFEPNAHIHLARVFDDVEYVYDYENRDYPLLCRLQRLVFVCYRDRIDLYASHVVNDVIALRATLNKLFNEKALGDLPDDLAKLIYNSYVDGNSIRDLKGFPFRITCIELLSNGDKEAVTPRYQYIEHEEIAYHQLQKQDLPLMFISHLSLEDFFAYADVESIRLFLKRYFKGIKISSYQPFFDKQDFWQTLKKLNQCGLIISEVHIIDEQITRSALNAVRLTLTCMHPGFLPVIQPNEVALTVYSAIENKLSLAPVSPSKYPDVPISNPRFEQSLEANSLQSFVVDAIKNKKNTVLVTG